MDRFEKHAEYIMKRGDSIIAEKKKRNSIIKRTTFSISGLCAAAIIGIIALHNVPSAPKMTSEVSEVISADITTSDFAFTAVTTVSETTETKTQKTKVTTKQTTSIITKSSSAVTTSQQDKINTITSTEKVTQALSISAVSESTETEQPADTNITKTIITEVTENIKTSINTEAISMNETEITCTSATSCSQAHANTDVTTSTTALENDGASAQTPDHKQLNWDEMAINQQYFMANFKGSLMLFSTAEKEVAEDEVGDYICNAFMSGYYDYDTDTYYHCEAKAFLIKGHPVEKMIAIQFEGSDNYYVYVNNANEENENMTG